MSWNYLQVEISGDVLFPTVGPGELTRAEAHAFVRTFLVRYAEVAPFVRDLVDAWDAGAQDDTVYAGTYLWTIYESDDVDAGAREWVDDLVRTLRASGSKKLRAAW
jgi:hypothetical protein